VHRQSSLILLFMQPLRRWSTPQSVHSWWSDSNPPGATIPLHTLAKPLSRLLYHRQALGIIAKRGDDPLSKDIVETLTSYLVFVPGTTSRRQLIVICGLGTRTYCPPHGCSFWTISLCEHQELRVKRG
jgi:hypothetical protein